MSQFKLFAGGAVALGLVVVVAYAVWEYSSALADRDKYLVRAERAEANVADLTKANRSLEATNRNCGQAAAEQSTIAAEAMDHRGALHDIMRQGPPAPGPHNHGLASGSATEAGAGTVPAGKGVALTDDQKILLIGFYNSFFADPGSLRVN